MQPRWRPPGETFSLDLGRNRCTHVAHTWKEVMGIRTLRIEKPEGSGKTPLLFAIAITPSPQIKHSFCIQTAPSPDPFVRAGGQRHSHYVKPDGGVLGWGWGWGWNEWWQLDTRGSNDSRRKPVEVGPPAAP